MTANQLVAYNLRLARTLRGLTQEEAAEALEPYLGRRWSKATFSAAETSAAAGNRQREFTADEILAFAEAFDLPVSWFLFPTGPEDHTVDLPEPDQVTLGKRKLRASDVVLNRLLPSPDGSPFMHRAVLFIQGINPHEQTPSNRDFILRITQKTAATVLAAVGDIDRWVTNLRDLANSLDAAGTKILDSAAADIDASVRKETDDANE